MQEQCSQPSPVNGVRICLYFWARNHHFPGRNRLPFLVTMKMQPESSWSDFREMNLLLKGDEPSFEMARVLCKSTMFQKEASGSTSYCTSIYCYLLMSPLFLPACSVSILKVTELLLSKTLPPLGHHNLHLLEWVQAGTCGNKEERADLKEVKEGHQRRWPMMGKDGGNQLLTQLSKDKTKLC